MARKIPKQTLVLSMNKHFSPSQCTFNILQVESNKNQFIFQLKNVHPPSMFFSSSKKKSEENVCACSSLPMFSMNSLLASWHTSLPMYFMNMLR